MKHLAKILAVGAVLAASAQFALAGSIYGTLNIASTPNGSNIYTQSGSNASAVFSGTGSTGQLIDGTFTGIPNGQSVTLDNFDTSLGFPMSGTQLFSTSGGGTTVQFFATGDQIGIFDPNFLNIAFTGYVTETGYTNSPATLLYSSQGPAGTKDSYSETLIAVTPEPSSLILMGTGLLSSAAMLIRSRRRAV